MLSIFTFLHCCCCFCCYLNLNLYLILYLFIFFFFIILIFCLGCCFCCKKNFICIACVCGTYFENLFVCLPYFFASLKLLFLFLFLSVSSFVLMLCKFYHHRLSNSNSRFTVFFVNFFFFRLFVYVTVT